ncbi:CaiB/BaiF CoA transferase family protein [Pseudorhodoferax sp.]|uniref:CaiB/BaiF CoA transferase family protein n=1 Tax=Pseudorhodoferax sp. TaxID=1993553 RepID=UPI002DD67135|nr:CoA transferase [Pseudorhodoferax sp.]
MASTTPSAGALAGIRVLDLTTVIMGPYGTRILADMGADVVKIEAPEGDTFRRYGPSRHAGMGGSVLNLHRNKRSVVLDLKQPAARAALDRLLAGADVLVHNLRPQVAARLGLDWDSVALHNPRIVVCAARGFGEDGPYGHKPAYDDLMQAGSGFAALNVQQHGMPRYAPTAWCDKIAGQAIAYAVLGALLHRERGGSGQQVEVPMFETAIDFMLVEHYGPGAFEPPLGPIGFPRQLSPQRKPYRTRDGWACILPYSDRNWQDFFAFVGQPQWLDDPRFADVAQRVQHVDALYAILESCAAERSTAEWVAFCDRVGIPCMPVLALEQLKDDAHVQAVGLLDVAEHPSEGRYRAVRSPLRFSATPWALRRHAPRTGEHTAEVLREAGLSDAEIDTLLATH